MTNDVIGVGANLYFSFDEGSGNVAHDSSSNGFDSSIMGASWEYQNCVSNSCLSFDGVNDVINVPMSYASSGWNEGTFEFWVYPRTRISPWAHLLHETQYYHGSRCAFHVKDDGRVNFGLTEYSFPIGAHQIGLVSNSSIPLNNWTYIVGTFNDSGMYIYINGVLDTFNDEDMGPLNYQEVSSYRYMGGTPPQGLYFFNGLMDEIRFSNRSMDADEIMGNYLLRMGTVPAPSPATHPLVVTYSGNERDVLAAAAVKAPVLVTESGWLSPQISRFIEDYEPDWVYFIGFNGIPAGIGDMSNYSLITREQVPGLFFPEAPKAVYVPSGDRERGILASLLGYYMGIPVIFDMEGNYSEILDIGSMSLPEVEGYYLNNVVEKGGNIDYLVLADMNSQEGLLAGRLAGMRNGFIVPVNGGNVSFENINGKLWGEVNLLGSRGLYHKNIMYLAGKPLYLAILGGNGSIPHIKFFDPGLEIFDDKDGWWLYSDLGYSDVNGDGFYDLALGRLEGLEAASLHMARESLPKNQSTVLIGEYKHAKFEDMKFFGGGMTQAFIAHTLLEQVNVSTKRIVEQKSFNLNGVNNSNVLKFLGEINAVIANSLVKNIIGHMFKVSMLPVTTVELADMTMYAVLEFDWDEWIILYDVLPAPRHLDVIGADISGQIGSPGMIGYFGMGWMGWTVPNDSRSYLELLLMPYNRAAEFDNLTFSGFLYDDHDMSASSTIKENVVREGGSVLGSSGIVHDPYTMHTSTVFFLCLAQGKPLGRAFIESVNMDPLQSTVGFAFLYMAYSTTGQGGEVLRYPMLYAKDKLERILYSDPAVRPLERRYQAQEMVYNAGPANSFVAVSSVVSNYSLDGDELEVLNADSYLTEPEKPIVPVFAREFVLPQNSAVNCVNVSGSYSGREATAQVIYNDSYYSNWTGIVIVCMDSLGFGDFLELDVTQEGLLMDCIESHMKPDVDYPYPNSTFWWREARLLDNRTSVMVFIPVALFENESFAWVLENASIEVYYEAESEMNVYAQNIYMGENETLRIEVMNQGPEKYGRLWAFVEGNGSYVFSEDVSILENSTLVKEFSFQPGLGDYAVTVALEAEGGIGPRYAYFSVDTPPALFVNDIPAIVVNEGEEAVFELDMQNTAGFQLENISARYEGPFVEYTNEFGLDGYGETILEVSVGVPESYAPGSYSGVMYFLPSNDKGVSVNITFMVPARASIQTDGLGLAETIKPGHYLEKSMYVKNMGNVPLTLDGNCEGFDGISCSFDAVGLQPGEEGFLEANVSVAGGHQPGIFSGKILISCEGASENIALDVNVSEVAYWTLSPLEWICHLPGCSQDFLVSNSHDSNMPLEVVFIAGNLSMFFDDSGYSVLPGEIKVVVLSSKESVEGFASGVYNGEIRISANSYAEPGFQEIETVAIAQGPEFTLEKEFSPDKVMLFWKQFVVPRMNHVEIYVNNTGDAAIGAVDISDEIPDGWNGKKPVISFVKRNRKSIVKGYAAAYENGRLNLSFNLSDKPLMEGEGLEIHYLIYAQPDAVSQQDIITQTFAQGRDSQGIYSVVSETAKIRVEYFNPPSWLRWLFIMIYRPW